MVGEFLKPWRTLVQVSCPLYPFSGSCHSKANKLWLFGAKGRLKKASLRSNTTYEAQVGGGLKRVKSMYGFVMVGGMFMTL